MQPRTNMPEPTLKEIARFHSYYLRKPEVCWTWQGGKFNDGYGSFTLRNITYHAHRVAYLIANGPFNQLLLVCHHCDNPPCCNPEHLFLGTQSDNIIDCFQKGRYIMPKGENHPSAILSDQEITEIRKLYATGNFTQKELGIKFSSSQTNICYIIRHERRK